MTNNKVIGSYVIGTELYRSANAQIHLAFHVMAKEKAVVKITQKSDGRIGDKISRAVKQEIFVLRKLSHPNIARIYEVLETDRSYYIVMEFLPFVSLQDYLKIRKYINENECRHFMSQLVSAVHHMHKSSVSGRSIRMDNIIIDCRGNIKLFDFSKSACFHKITSNDLTNLCLAPDVIQNQEYGPAEDIWILIKKHGPKKNLRLRGTYTMGICMYQMLSGKYPNADKTCATPPGPFSTAMNGLQRIFNISIECHNLLDSMLTNETSDRITIDKVVLHPWFYSLNTFRSVINLVPSLSKQSKPILKKNLISRVSSFYKVSEDKVGRSVVTRSLDNLSACYYFLDKDWSVSANLSAEREDIIDVSANLRQDGRSRFIRLSQKYGNSQSTEVKGGNEISSRNKNGTKLNVSEDLHLPVLENVLPFHNKIYGTGLLKSQKCHCKHKFNHNQDITKRQKHIILGLESDIKGLITQFSFKSPNSNFSLTSTKNKHTRDLIDYLNALKANNKLDDNIEIICKKIPLKSTIDPKQTIKKNNNTISLNVFDTVNITHDTAQSNGTVFHPLSSFWSETTMFLESHTGVKKIEIKVKNRQTLK